MPRLMGIGIYAMLRYDMLWSFPFAFLFFGIDPGAPAMLYTFALPVADLGGSPELGSRMM